MLNARPDAASLRFQKLVLIVVELRHYIPGELLLPADRNLKYNV